MPCLGSVGMNYKVICRWLLLVLVLEMPGKGQATNQGWWPLVPRLGSPSNRYRVQKGQPLLLWEIFRKVKNMSQERLFVWNTHWIWLVWACTLGVVESQVICRILGKPC